MDKKTSAVEVHAVANGWMVHPSRGWLDQGNIPTWDDRIWVFNKFSDLCRWLEDTLMPYASMGT